MISSLQQTLFCSWTALFDLRRDDAMLVDVELVMDSAGDSGATVRIKHKERDLSIFLPALFDVTLGLLSFLPPQIQQTGFAMRNWTLREQRKETAVVVLGAKAGYSATSREFTSVLYWSYKLLSNDGHFEHNPS